MRENTSLCESQLLFNKKKGVLLALMDADMCLKGSWDFNVQTEMNRVSGRLVQEFNDLSLLLTIRTRVNGAGSRPAQTEVCRMLIFA